MARFRVTFTFTFIIIIIIIIITLVIVVEQAMYTCVYYLEIVQPVETY
jgi:hypothetical protein